MSNQRLVMILVLSALWPIEAAHASGLEVFSISPPSSIAKNIAKRAFKKFDSGGRPSPWGMSKEFKSKLIQLRGKFGEKSFATPVTLDLAVTATPNLSPEELRVERQLDLTISRKNFPTPSSRIDLHLQHKDDRENTVFLIYKFSL